MPRGQRGQNPKANVNSLHLCKQQIKDLKCFIRVLRGVILLCQGLQGCYVVMSRTAGVLCCYVKDSRGVMLLCQGIQGCYV